MGMVFSCWRRFRLCRHLWLSAYWIQLALACWGRQDYDYLDACVCVCVCKCVCVQKRLCVHLCLFLCVSVGLYLSLSVYACSCLFLSVAVCFLQFLFVFHMLRIQHIISITSLFIIWVMPQYIFNLQHILCFVYSLHSLYHSTRVTCSSTLSGHPSSSCCSRKMVNKRFISVCLKQLSNIIPRIFLTFSRSCCCWGYFFGLFIAKQNLFALPGRLVPPCEPKRCGLESQLGWTLGGLKLSCDFFVQTIGHAINVNPREFSDFSHIQLVYNWCTWILFGHGITLSDEFVAPDGMGPGGCLLRHWHESRTGAEVPNTEVTEVQEVMEMTAVKLQNDEEPL